MKGMSKSISGGGLLTLIISTIGASLGIFIFLAGFQFYFDLHSIMNDKNQIATADFIMMNKRTTNMEMLGLTDGGFTQEEIDEIKKQPFTKDIGAIQNALFSINASLRDVKAGIEMSTVMYFAAVDDKFIDVEDKTWKWKIGDRAVPIILPSLFVQSYNYGIAPSNGMPPMTEKTFKNFNFIIEIKNEKNTFITIGKIQGFSDRISTILVPKSFLNWANNNFAEKKIANPKQLVIESNDLENPEFSKFINDHNYETNLDNLQNSKIKSILNICLLVLVPFGLIVILLALIGFLQFSVLRIISRTNELKLLMSLGYSYAAPLKSIGLTFTILTLLIGIGTFTGLYFFKGVLTNYLEEYYFKTTSEINNTVIIIGIFTIFMFYTANILNLLRLLIKLAKNLH